MKDQTAVGSSSVRTQHTGQRHWFCIQEILTSQFLWRNAKTHRTRNTRSLPYDTSMWPRHNLPLFRLAFWDVKTSMAPTLECMAALGAWGLVEGWTLELAPFIFSDSLRLLRTETFSPPFTTHTHTLLPLSREKAPPSFHALALCKRGMAPGPDQAHYGTLAVDANGSRSATPISKLPTPSFGGFIPTACYLSLMDGEDALLSRPSSQLHSTVLLHQTQVFPYKLHQ